MHKPTQPLHSSSITRRTVIGTAAAMPFVGSLSIPSVAKAQGGSTPIRLGIIGMGKRSYGLLNACLRNPKLRVLAVSDVDTTRRETAKSKADKAYGNSECDAYSDYRHMMDRKDIDAVMIITPDHWHAIQCLHASNARKHIYCEKPLTHTILESQKIVEAVKKSGVVFQTGSQQRSDFGDQRGPYFARAAEYVRNGMAGACEVAYGNVGKAPRWCALPEEPMEPGLDWDLWQGPVPARSYNSILAPRGMHDHFPRWRDYREYAGGLLADFGAHHFDIIQWAWDKDNTSPVKVIPSENRRSGYGSKLIYADGKTLHHGGLPGVPGSSVFVCEKGHVQATRKSIKSDIEGLLEQQPPQDGFNAPRGGHLNNFIHCVETGELPVAPAEAGARTAVLCHLMALSYFHGETLDFNPDTWRFKQAHANEWLDYERRKGYELPEIM